jgi:DNA-directed RNA polymerase specialized sigma24 family protein
LRHAGETFNRGAAAVALAGPEAAAGASMELARLRDSPSKLPPSCRDAFLLSIEVLTHAEIAGRLGMSVCTIDRFMVKAWAHLRRDFGTEFEDRDTEVVGATLGLAD